MKILGLESSCDDTCCGIIKNQNKTSWELLSNFTMTQKKMLEIYGGVVPEVSARNHLDNITLTLENALKNANISLKEIDIIGATIGPGMIGSLIVGSTFGSTLAKITGKIFIPVHHLEAHILIAAQDFPFLALLISGGHTMIVECQDFGKYRILMETLDDALGEFFDKLARKMGLSFPGGPDLERISIETKEKCPVKIPMKNKTAFSFSGIKTEFSKLLDIYPKETIAFWMQQLAADIIKEKIEIAIKISGIEKIVACGGVASNKYIRKSLECFNVFFPLPSLCIDNGAMSAVASMYHYHYKTNKVNNFNYKNFARLSLEKWMEI